MITELMLDPHRLISPLSLHADSFQLLFDRHIVETWRAAQGYRVKTGIKNVPAPACVRVCACGSDCLHLLHRLPKPLPLNMSDIILLEGEIAEAGRQAMSERESGEMINGPGCTSRCGTPHLYQRHIEVSRQTQRSLAFMAQCIFSKGTKPQEFRIVDVALRCSCVLAVSF